MTQTEIGIIGNYYGCLNVMTLDGKFYWCIENYDTDFDDLEDWSEISEELYNSIIKFYNNKYLWRKDNTVQDKENQTAKKLQP